MYVVVFLAGALVWTLAEHLLHDRMGHRANGRNDFSREHLRHHAEREYFTPTLKKIRTASPVILAAACVAGWVAGPLGCVGVMGFTVAYVSYEWLHRRLHTHAPWNSLGKMLRKHHFYHHFGDATKNHGVTSPVWDWVLGSGTVPGRIRVPEARAMRWLVDPGTGDVRREWAEDYVLVCRRRPVVSGPSGGLVSGPSERA